MDEHPIRSLGIIALLIIINAFVSAAEAALSNCNESSVRKRAEEGDVRAESVLRLLSSSTSYINVVELLLISINLIIGMVFSFSHFNLIRDLIRNELFHGKMTLWEPILLVCLIVLLIYVIVVFGVLVPKKLSIKNSEKLVYRYGLLIRVISIILFPVLWVMEKNTRLIFWILRIKPEELEENVTEEEIISIVNEGQEKGVLEAGEAEMISNIIEFDEKEAKDIMTHRKKIVAVNDEMSIEEALRFMLEESYSRFPLYHEGIDDIVGILHLKDVMKFHLNPEWKDKSLTEVASEPYFVPDTQNIDLLLRDMQRKKVHMAIVIDEYGQTTGLVAMEDILEEIVGDIQDEHDEEEVKIFHQGDQVYLVLGDTPLEELKDEIEIEIEEDDFENYDTVNGLLISKLDRIPSDGETETIAYGGYQFDILDTSNKMIKLVRVSKQQEQTEKQAFPLA